MKSFHLCIFFFLLPILGIVGQTEDSISEGQDLLKKAYAKNLMVGASAGFAVDGAIKFTDGIGLADRDSEQAFNADTKVRIASIAKPMTAIAIMQLVEKGMIDLDKSVQTYIPNYPIKTEGTITIRQLLQHSSGIPAYKSSKEVETKKNYPTLGDAIEIFKDRDLLAVPGEDFNYTSYGYVVLGKVIENVSGQTYGDYMQEHIWSVLGMNNTSIEEYGKTYENKSAFYSRTKKDKLKEKKQNNISNRIPGGGFHSTSADILKFGIAVLSNTLITQESLNQLIENSGLKKEGNGYGMGWYLYGPNDKLGEEGIYGHTGGQTGCSAVLYLLPKNDIVVVCLSNTSHSMDIVNAIAINLFDIAAKAKK